MLLVCNLTYRFGIYVDEAAYNLSPYAFLPMLFYMSPYAFLNKEIFLKSIRIHGFVESDTRLSEFLHKLFCLRTHA